MSSLYIDQKLAKYSRISLLTKGEVFVELLCASLRRFVTFYIVYFSGTQGRTSHQTYTSYICINIEEFSKVFRCWKKVSFEKLQTRTTQLAKLSVHLLSSNQRKMA
jgi:hypothetical protein